MIYASWTERLGRYFEGTSWPGTVINAPVEPVDKETSILIGTWDFHDRLPGHR